MEGNFEENDGMLLLKLILTPLLIGMASVAGRRWGPVVSGWLIGLPLTSAPVALFLAFEQGTTFASRVAQGTLMGLFSQAAFFAIFTHHFQGATTARHILHGVIVSSFACAVFFLIVAGLLVQQGIVVAFSATLLAALLAQGCTLWLVMRPCTLHVKKTRTPI